MQKFGHLLLLLLLVTGLYSLTGCGGAAGTLGVNNQPGHSVDGVTTGGFEAIRYNDSGFADSALNGTLDLQVSQDGATTTVTISVADNAPMWGAAVELYYDPAQFSPVKSDFAGLVDTALQLANSNTAGIVNLGQADVDGTAVRSGEFAVVTFANNPVRFTAAAGDAHSVLVNRAYAPAQIAPTSLAGFSVTDTDADAADNANYEMHSTFAIGDGDQNGATNISDLTSMVANGYFGPANAITAADFGTAPTDFNGDGETGVADLTIMSQHLNEQTTGIDVLIADDGTTFDGTQSVLQSFTWQQGTQPTRPPAAGTTDLTALFVEWNGEVTQAQVQAADTDGDGNVDISARTTGTGAAGPTFTPGITVSGGTPPPANVVITGATVTVGGTNFTANGDASVTANDANLQLSVSAISGMYNGTDAFDGGPAGAMTQAEYDTALAQAAATAAWTSTKVGDETNNKFYTAGGWVLNLSASTGAAITAAVTADADNPDSTTATTPEGLLNVNIPANGAFIPGALNFDIRIDVVDDAAAPVFTSLNSSAPPVGSFQGISPTGDTIIQGDFTLGTAALPVDLNDVDVRLVDVLNTGASDIVLTYTVNQPPAPGQFTIDTTGAPRLIAAIPATAQPGAAYGLHMSYDNGAGGTTTSSVNYPNGTAIFALGQAPPAVTFNTVPEGTDIAPNNDVLLIFYPDPKVRRDPRVDFAGTTLTFEDPDGEADIVKNNGDEFVLSAVPNQPPLPGGRPFPEVIVVQGTDPTVITSTTPGEVGVSVVYRTQGCIAVDISALTFGGTTPVNYAYRVYGGAADQANWPLYGEGTFTYDPTGLAPSAPFGIDFGVNIFDGGGRGDLALGARDYSSKNIDASTIPGPAQAGSTTQDVLWIELSSFGYYDFDIVDPFDYDSTLSGKNTHLRLTDQANASSIEVGLQPRTGALSANGEVLVTFEPGQQDGNGNAMWFANPGAPGWVGILEPGHTYDVTLVDPASPASDFTFATPLIVTGTNPN